MLSCQPTTTPAPRMSRIASAPPTYSSTSQLAQRLQQNWLARHPGDACNSGGEVDDSLTSLNWLQNLNILKITSPTPPASPPSSAPSGGPQKLMRGMSAPVVHPHQVVGGMVPSLPVKQEPHMSLADTPPLCGTSLITPEAVDYRTNPYVKPPYSYATLICMAMKETKKHKITLSSIYNWITDNFMYYRMADPSWQVCASCGFLLLSF